MSQIEPHPLNAAQSTAHMGPDNLGFVFDDSNDIQHRDLQRFKNNIEELFQYTTDRAKSILERDIADGKIPENDFFGQQLFLAEKQLTLFRDHSESPWLRISGGGEQSRSGAFELSKFQGGWFLLGLDQPPFSASESAKVMLRELANDISAGELETDVLVERGWATSVVTFTVNPTSDLISQILAGFLHVTAMVTEREQPGRFPWSPPIIIKTLHVTWKLDVQQFEFDNRMWEARKEGI